MSSATGSARGKPDAHPPNSRQTPMFVFAHLHKCAGTSVVREARRAGMVLPVGHQNGHLRDSAGHALGGMSRMSTAELDGLLRSLVQRGVQFLAIEWDFPLLEKFPKDLDLRFFTIFRDPVERILSNYAYDVTMGFSPARSLREWMELPEIWARPNYDCRFFSELRVEDVVEPSHVDYVAGTLSTHFKVAFTGDHLLDFLRNDVGLPFVELPRDNKVSAWRKGLKWSRLRLSPAERAQLREMNALDYQLCDRLLARRAAPMSLPGSRTA